MIKFILTLIGFVLMQWLISKPLRNPGVTVSKTSLFITIGWIVWEMTVMLLFLPLERITSIAPWMLFTNLLVIFPTAYLFVNQYRKKMINIATNSDLNRDPKEGPRIKNQSIKPLLTLAIKTLILLGLVLLTWNAFTIWTSTTEFLPWILWLVTMLLLVFSSFIAATSLLIISFQLLISGEDLQLGNTWLILSSKLKNLIRGKWGNFFIYASPVILIFGLVLVFLTEGIFWNLFYNPNHIGYRSDEKENNTPVRHPNETESILLKTPTITISPAYTSSPTSTETPTPTLTPSPTWTRQPTLPTTLVAYYVELLLRKNMGCRLPCWWGFIPGKTPWHEAQSFLETFAQVRYLEKKPDQDFSIGDAVVPVSTNIASSYLEYEFIVKDKIIQTMRVYPGISSTYNFHNFVSTYGEPEQVWIETYSVGTPFGRYFGVYLFYPHQGILAMYGDESTLVGGKIRGCFNEKDDIPDFLLWSPKQEMSLEEAVKLWSHSFPIPFLLPIEKASEMEVSDFYAAALKSQVCVDTSADLWPKE